MDTVFCWVEQHPGIAAWVQAVGAIVALAATIWLNRKDAKERHVERDARARHVSLTIKPILDDFIVEIDSALKGIKDGKDPYQAGPFRIDGPDDSPTCTPLGICGIESPPTAMTAVLVMIPQLAGAEKPTFAALQSMYALNREFWKHYDSDSGEFHYDDQGQLVKTLDAMRLTSTMTKKARDAIERLYS